MTSNILTKNKTLTRLRFLYIQLSSLKIQNTVDFIQIYF
jgi:hypothetical protein